MVNKDYCCSAFLAFRYIPRPDIEFAEGLHHINAPLPAPVGLSKVKNAADADYALERVFDDIKNQKSALLLSGGMDSATLATYMKGQDAYTFRFLGGNFGGDELRRAERFASLNNMNLHYVDINFDAVKEVLPAVMHHRGAPVHSIEPQIYLAARQAAADGIEQMVIGDAADYVFGGMDGLLSKDWGYDEFIARYTYINPVDVLRSPADVNDLFEPYRRGNKIDFITFLDGPNTIESYSSYMNAFASANMPYVDPYEHLQRDFPLNLERIRHGESKYVVRDLFRMRYGENPPQKVPMPRPVDSYFADWDGPKRPEFRNDIAMERFDGNRRWLMYSLEYFLNLMNI